MPFHHKFGKHLILFIVGMAMLSACGLSKSAPAQQTVQEKPAVILTVEPVSDNKTIDPVRPQSASQEVLLKTQNDITVKITSTKMIGTGVEIGICYTAPDNGEWRPLPAHLFYDKYEVFPDEIHYLDNEIPADGKNTGTRCALVRYRIDDPNTITTPIKFSILQFYAPGREMYSPCEELRQRLATNPKAQTYGLRANCVENGDGNISVALVGNNQTVAKDIASKVLAQIAKAEVAGPWEFTLNEIER